MAQISPIRSEPLLNFFRKSSAIIITLICILLLVTDLNAFPFLTREAFIRQNVDLITNYADLSVVELDIIKRKERGVDLNIDLVYGEPSFLVLVIFVNLVSYVITCRAQTAIGEKDERSMSIFLLIISLISLVYIQAFSGMLYALIFAILTTRDALIHRNFKQVTLRNLLGLSILAICGIIVVIKTAPYFFQRIATITSGGSAQQRFSVMLEFLPIDFLLGLQSAERMPIGGVHNGVIYLLMVAGVGGIAVLACLVGRVIRMSSPLGLSTLSVLTVLAIFSQDGGIFSPNKIVVISLLLGPLCVAYGKSHKTHALTA